MRVSKGTTGQQAHSHCPLPETAPAALAHSADTVPSRLAPPKNNPAASTTHSYGWQANPGLEGTGNPGWSTKDFTIQIRWRYQAPHNTSSRNSRKAGLKQQGASQQAAPAYLQPLQQPGHRSDGVGHCVVVVRRRRQQQLHYRHHARICAGAAVKHRKVHHLLYEPIQAACKHHGRDRLGQASALHC